MAKKVAIIGAFSFPNFGDQLLLKVLADKLKSIEPSIILCVPFVGEGIERLPNIEYGGGYEKLAKCNMTIFGGGGYFGETPRNQGVTKKYTNILDRNADNLLFKITGLSKYLGKGRPLRVSTLSFINYFKISKFCKDKKIKFFILGTGLGPVTTTLGRYCVRYILKNAELVYLRDEESLKFAKELVPNKEVLLTSDHVLAMDDKEAISFKNESISNIGLHLGQITSEEQLNSIYSLCDFLQANDFKVNVLMDNFDPVELKISKELSCNYGFKLVEYSNSIDSFIDEISNLDMIITTKLHSGIVGYSLGVVPISLPAHPKSKRFYNQVGLSSLCTELSKQGGSDSIIQIKQLKELNKSEIEKLLNLNRAYVLELNSNMLKKIKEYL